MKLRRRAARQAAEREYAEESERIAEQFADILATLSKHANAALMAQVERGEPPTDSKPLTRAGVDALAAMALMLAAEALGQARRATYVEPANSAVDRARGFIELARAVVEIGERLGYL